MVWRFDNSAMAYAQAMPLTLRETERATASRLQAAFERAGNPMLMVDDQRRCVTANTEARDMLGIEAAELPWRRIDDFTPAADRDRLDEEWATFLAHGAIEGWYSLPVPSGHPVPVEFSATAHVLPERHLAVVMPRPASAPVRREEGWTRTAVREQEPRMLTSREAEVLGLVAAGLQGTAIATELVLSPETIKSHVQNAMTKLGAHTRAHAVAIALRTGQLDLPAHR